MLRGKVPCKGSPAGTGGSEHLELHGAFSTSLRAPGTESLSRSGFRLARHHRAEIAFGVLRGVPVGMGSLQDGAGCLVAGTGWELGKGTGLSPSARSWLNS
jgi:hypothetical protein